VRNWSARRWALIVAVILGVSLVAVIVVTTPWRTLGPVPGGPVAVDPARDFTAAEIAREDAYHSAVRPPAYAALAVSFALALLLGLTPLGARVIGAVGGRGRRAVGRLRLIVLGALVLTALGSLATLPFDARAESVMRDYNLSTQTWGSWAIDRLKAFGINAVVIVFVLFVLFALVRRAPRWWWIPACALAALMVVVGSFVYPVLIEPVFNTFKPMEPGPLKSSLIALADEDGLPVKDVLVADASRRTNRLNAYVSGFGSTRRIVVYDTTLRDMSPEEIRLITAHELGHVKHHDVLRGTLIGALGVAFGVCLLYLVLELPWLQRRAGVSALADPRSIALILAMVAVFTQVATPLELLVSRRIEARADVHALDLVRDPAGQIAMQHRLAVANLADLDPNPIVYGLFASHPTPPERIAIARNWAKINGVSSG
jgi:Zn-dependent protease with chaperone function